MLSAVVFVFWPEEENYIETTLKTVSFADEIIVIDNGATKKTLEIVKKYTSKIYQTQLQDFAARHNFAKEKTKGDWILYIDADERISVALQKEIKETLRQPYFDAYQLLRENFFLGKRVRYGDRYPDYVTRLFNRNKSEDWTGEIHESSNVAGKISKMEAPLYHFTHRDIFSMMEKTMNFSEHEAQLRFKANHPPVVWWRLLRVLASEAYLRLIKYQGIRQGTEGWIDGLYQSFSLFTAYARLWELQRQPQLLETYKKYDQDILEGKSLL